MALAQSFADRVVGLSEGRVVFDGAPERLSSQVLTDIYGEEDWSTTVRKVEDDDEAAGDEDGRHAAAS